MGLELWRAGTQPLYYRLGQELHGRAFEPLRDPQEFGKLSLNPERGTITWPNGADFAPEFLYAAARRAGA